MENLFQKLHIGTSGYSYTDWKNIFYPARIGSTDMLPFYAQHFDCVEINMTYYTIPMPDVFEGMVNKTPDNFEFIVKVHQETTHIRRQNREALKKINFAVQPLKKSGKFGGFLAQFPYSFHNNEKNRNYLLETANCIFDSPLFIEFRHHSWNKPAVLDFFKKNNLGYVNVDQPDLRGLIPAQDWLSNNLGYIRFHGRNKQKWWNGKGMERYNYDYKPDELEKWLIRISEILKKSYKTYVFFNNHPQGQAPKNAQFLKQQISRYIERK